MRLFEMYFWQLKVQEKERFEKSLTKHKEAQRRLKHKIIMKWKGGKDNGKARI